MMFFLASKVRIFGIILLAIFTKLWLTNKFILLLMTNLAEEMKSPPSFLKAIEESQIAIIIFSQDYACSRWCLEELVKIIECKKNHGQIVIPVFYKVDPSVVRKQTWSFEVAFAKHQSSKKNSSQVQKWKDALNLAGNISGFDSRVVKSESTFIEKIVQQVLKDLKRQNNVSPSVNKNLVGMESRIKDIELLLGAEDHKHNDVRSVGIWGIGGIGKTTLAKAVCKKISWQFEGFHFVENVREALEKKESKCLRQELYLAILGDKNVYSYQLIKKRFSCMKLFIILDDITSVEQVEELFGDLDYSSLGRDLDCFGLGSQIIITSRNKQVLENCEVDCIYKVKELSFDDSFKVFCQYAFEQNYPKEGYTKLSKVVKKVEGVPLALKVLGFFLRGKNKEVWESSMKKLENSLDNNIYKVLKISYDGLDPDQQRLFLDIACFYKGLDVNLVIAIMDVSGFDIHYDLSALEDKSLIFKLDNKLMMHDLLQAMGKRIVQQESIDPGERTRLCNHEDIYRVLMNDMGTKKIEGISWDMSNIRDIRLHPNAFVNMPNLRILQFYTSNCWRDNNKKVHAPQDLKLLLTELRCFQWDRCPLKSLQSNSSLENLVTLKLPNSNVEQLWSDGQQFNHLKEIDLLFSRKLISFPNLKGPKLEHLCLSGCKSLIEMPSSFRHLTRLGKLSLELCVSIMSVLQLPESLHDLRLFECSSLTELPSSIQHLNRMKGLDLWGCKSLTSIPECSGWISLSRLDLNGCSKLERLPKIPNSLKILNLMGCTSLFEIPSSFKCLNTLWELTFGGCERLASIPDLTGLKSLSNLKIDSCSKLKVLPEFPNKLERLTLEGCENLTSIADLMGLKSLRHLTINSCSKLEMLPEFPNNLCELILIKCGITEIPESVTNLSELSFLNISHCERLRVLPKLPWAHGDACNCTSLQELSCPSFPNYCFSNFSTPFPSDGPWFMDSPSPRAFSCLMEHTEQGMMTASLPSFPLDGQVCVRRYPTLHISYPGSEIPEQFTFHCSGSFIDVKLPLDWTNYNSLCFALCAVVSFRDQFGFSYYSRHLSDAVVIYTCYSKSKEGDHNWKGIDGALDGIEGVLGRLRCPADCMKSSHVIIWFGLHFFGKHDNEFTFKFGSRYDHINKEFCKVEKCGVHLIFGKHLDESDSEESMEEDEPHLEEFNEEDEPHPKRLKHI